MASFPRLEKEASKARNKLIRQLEDGFWNLCQKQI